MPRRVSRPLESAPGIISAASLQYRLTSGTAINPGFLNLNGTVTSVISPDLETTGSSPTIYDFSPFTKGGIMSLTYNQAGVDFANIIANGGTVTGTGGFSEAGCSRAVIIRSPGHRPVSYRVLPPCI